MSHRFFTPILLCIALLQVGNPADTKAQERVAHFHFMNGQIQEGSTRYVGNFVPDFYRESQEATFFVYTTSQIDAKLTQRASVEDVDALIRWITRIQEPGGVIDHKIREAEKRLYDNVVVSINDLSQRLLSDQAQAAIQRAVLAEITTKLDSLGTVMRKEMGQIRADLQAQIDQNK